jgi:hypothetical protein
MKKWEFFYCEKSRKYKNGPGNAHPASWEFVALTTQHPLPTKLGTKFATCGGRFVGIVRLRTKATEFSLFDMGNC